jgi:hypothetical protein
VPTFSSDVFFVAANCTYAYRACSAFGSSLSKPPPNAEANDAARENADWRIEWSDTSVVLLLLPVVLLLDALLQLSIDIYNGDSVTDSKDVATHVLSAVHAIFATLTTSAWTPPAKISYALVSSSGLLAALYIAAFQLALPARSAQLSNRLRGRLRWRINRALVTLPRLPIKFKYDLFLSHVWGEGTQEKMRVVKESLKVLLLTAHVFLDVVCTSLFDPRASPHTPPPHL